MPYITPETTPPGSFCWRLTIPDDTRMVAALLGQILELAEAENWEETDGITAVAAAKIWETIYAEFSQGEACRGS